MADLSSLKYIKNNKNDLCRFCNLLARFASLTKNLYENLGLLDLGMGCLVVEYCCCSLSRTQPFWDGLDQTLFHLVERRDWVWDSGIGPMSTKIIHICLWILWYGFGRRSAQWTIHYPQPSIVCSSCRPRHKHLRGMEDTALWGNVFKSVS